MDKKTSEIALTVLSQAGERQQGPSAPRKAWLRENSQDAASLGRGFRACWPGPGAQLLQPSAL